MCRCCDPESQDYCIGYEVPCSDPFIEILTHRINMNTFEFDTNRIYIDYCPNCGRPVRKERKV